MFSWHLTSIKWTISISGISKASIVFFFNVWNLFFFQVELQLFKLFHNERRIKDCEADSEAKRKELVKIEKRKEAAEEKLKEAKKEHGKSQREFAKVDSDIREKENAIQKKRPAFIKAKEKTAHIQKKADNAKKSLKQAEKAFKSHQSDVQVIYLSLNS